MLMSKKIISIILSTVIGASIIGGGVGWIVASQQAPQQKLGDSSLLAYDWLENSGEASALEYQAYNQATQQIIQDSKVKTEKPKAVIMDIDETVLNNGGFLGWQVLNNKGYSKDAFSEWASMHDATAVDGALQFTKKCEELGIKVYYISNRYEDKDLDGTIQNLKDLGFPYASKSNVLLKTKASSKEQRWQSVQKDYDVVLYVGDNLTDFNKNFEHTSNKDLKVMVDKDASMFGDKYIIIPNPVYGQFESAIYDYKFTKSDEQKLQDRFSLVDGADLQTK